MSPAVRPSTDVLVVACLALAFVAAASLLLPWIRVRGSERSSIDFIGSAGALDVIEGGVKVLVVLGWLLIPVVVAAALVVSAAGKVRLGASLIVPLGPLLAGLVVLVRVVAGNVMAWGAYLTAVLAVAASAVAVLALRSLARRPA